MRVRDLIGKEIEWEEHVCPKVGYGLTRSGVLLEVKGRNLLVDKMGSVEWMWLPLMHNLRLLERQLDGM